MPNTRHPSYHHDTDALISSTEAARILRTSPHDPLAFHRLDQLRAARKLVPAEVGSDCWFLRSDVERHARPWEHTDTTPPASAARGVLLAITISGIVLGLAAFAAIRWLR